MAKTDKKNLEVNFLLVAEYAMYSEDKKLNVIGVFDEVNALGLPAQHAKMAIVLGLTGEAGETETLTLKITSPTGKEDFSGNVSFKYGKNGKANGINNLEGFTFKEVGNYKISFERDGKEIAKSTLKLVVVQGKKDAHLVA